METTALLLLDHYIHTMQLRVPSRLLFAAATAPTAHNQPFHLITNLIAPTSFELRQSASNFEFSDLRIHYTEVQSMCAEHVWELQRRSRSVA